MGWSAFKPGGETVCVAVTGTASTDVQACPDSAEGQSTSYLVTNAGTVTCFLGVGAASGAAALKAVIPVAGTPSYAIPIMATSAQTFTFGNQSWFSAITAAGETTLYITPGDGL